MSGGSRLENANPVIFQRSGDRLVTSSEEDEEILDPIDEREIFDILLMGGLGCLVSVCVRENACYVHAVALIRSLTDPHLIRSINDPEHPLSLEELNVVEQVRVNVVDQQNCVSVEFTPTIPHCSMATLIGLSIKVKLLRSLPERFKIDVHITPGTHASEEAVNKQLADKERVAAALENSSLLEVVNHCLSARSA
ncbi:unnamed protein product [Ophioblennius macclurei]